MLNPINPIAKNVTKGRHVGARHIVLSSLSSLDCVVLKKVIDEIKQDDRDSFIYGDEVEKLSDADEHAFHYELKGSARMLLDRYAGGNIHRNFEYADYEENTLYAQIEPYELGLGLRESVMTIPDWKVESNDIVAISLNGDIVGYLEVVGVQGVSINDNYGIKYKLNKRDDFNFLIKEDE